MPSIVYKKLRYLSQTTAKVVAELLFNSVKHRPTIRSYFVTSVKVALRIRGGFFKKVPERFWPHIIKEKTRNLALQTLATSFSCQMQVCVLQLSFL
jgi:hypothetical protein